MHGSHPSCACIGGISLKASLCNVSNKQVPDCVVLISTGELLHTMRGLGEWASAGERARSTRLKARGKVSSRGKSLLSMKSESRSGESAAVHHAKTSLLSLGDEVEIVDKDPAVARTVESLSVAGSDTPVVKQEKEARSVGGIPSR